MYLATMALLNCRPCRMIAESGPPAPRTPPSRVAGNSPVYSHGCKSPLPVAEGVAGKPGCRTPGRKPDFRYSSQGCSELTLYGYARVSVREPEDKNLGLQVERLVRAGCAMGNIRAEEASGAKDDRGGLLELLDLVVEGDTLVVTHIDRLSRGLTYGLQAHRGSAPGGSGVPVPSGRPRHGHVHRQAPALDGARLQRVGAELDQGAVGGGPGEGAYRGPFPWATAEPDRATTGVHQDRAVEGSAPEGTGQTTGGQPLDHPTGGRVERWVENASSTRISCVVQVASITPPQWSIISAPLTDEYESRTWADWHHHVALCLLGGAFLLSLQQAWGRKDAPDHEAAGVPGGAGNAAPGTVRAN